MEYALIKNNVVENIIVADEDFIAALEGYDHIVNTEGFIVGVGWDYVDGDFRKKSESTHSGITTITMRQLRLALLKNDALKTVQTILPTLPSPAKEEVEIEWQYATVVKRQGFIQHLAKACNWSDEYLDNLFNLAATL